MINHTPLPWIDQGDGIVSHRLFDGNQGLVVDCYYHQMGHHESNHKENAKFITIACNAHYDLLEALLDALPYVEDVLSNPEELACFKKGIVQKHANAIRAAISKATN